MKMNSSVNRGLKKFQKICISLFVVSIFIVGCTKADIVKSESKDEKLNVYCERCGDKFHKKTNYCPDCGSKGIWLSEKTQLSKSKNIDNKRTESEYKYEYLAKLDDMSEELNKQTGTLIEEESVYSQADVEKEKFITWDNMLNEIYCLLPEELTTKEFKDLKIKQTKWLNYRERKANKDADKFEGMYFANVQYNLTLSKLTKERCYELVNNYL